MHKALVLLGGLLAIFFLAPMEVVKLPISSPVQEWVGFSLPVAIAIKISVWLMLLSISCLQFIPIGNSLIITISIEFANVAQSVFARTSARLLSSEAWLIKIFNVSSREYCIVNSSCIPAITISTSDSGVRPIKCPAPQRNLM
jgi:hypothetical protein